MKKNFNTIYKQALTDILQKGHEARPRGFITKELFGYQCRLNIEEPVLINKSRSLNYAFLVAEWLWILFGRNDVAFISLFNKKIIDYSDDGKHFYGAYGPQFTRQLEYVYNTLKTDPQSRQAVMTFWQQNPASSKDIPCTVGLHFMLRAGKLNCFSLMRSNDAFLGFPYDVFNFSQLTNMLASMLLVERGELIYNANSLHLYQTEFTRAQQVINDLSNNNNETRLLLPRIKEITSYKQYCTLKEQFNTLADQMVKYGPQEEEMISDAFPPGLREHLFLINNYLKRQNVHQDTELWRTAYGK